MRYPSIFCLCLTKTILSYSLSLQARYPSILCLCMTMKILTQSLLLQAYLFPFTTFLCQTLPFFLGCIDRSSQSFTPFRCLLRCFAAGQQRESEHQNTSRQPKLPSIGHPNTNHGHPPLRLSGNTATGEKATRKLPFRLVRYFSPPPPFHPFTLTSDSLATPRR